MFNTIVSMSVNGCAEVLTCISSMRQLTHGSNKWQGSFAM